MTDRSRRGRAAMLWTDGGGRADSARGIALLTSLLMIDSLHFVFAPPPPSLHRAGSRRVLCDEFAALQVGILGLALGRLRLEPLLRLCPYFWPSVCALRLAPTSTMRPWPISTRASPPW